MNDLDLHSRLTGLADQLAPDADPYAQIDGARSLHRRRQRTRLGVAGAAVAVALVAVGVPTAVGSLSSSPDRDAARPSPSSDALRGPADAVRARMAWPEDGLVPDPDPGGGRPCPEAAEVVQVDSRYRPVLMPGTEESTGTVCMWATDWTGTVLAETRVDLELSAVDLDADRLLEQLEEDGGCPWTTLFPERSLTVLRVCEVPVQRRWELFVLDDDGTGGWAMTAAVGEDLPAGFTVAAESLAALWGVVLDLDAEVEEEVATERLDRAVVGGLAALAARPDLRLDARDGMECTEAADELSASFGPELTPITDRSAPDLLDCAWISESQNPPVDVSVRFLADVDGSAVDKAASGVTVVDDVRGTVTTRCSTPTTSAEGLRTALTGCAAPDRTQLVLAVEDAAGTGVWVLQADVPLDSSLDAAAALVLVLEAAERTW